ncbi:MULTISPECIES: hypothetical protein [Bacteria]|uniref:hypothetical protein n=1 Tax=Bacteria TaxID=2 RepID=UPI003C79A104
MSGSTWTPAPRPGLIPLHPLGFGTILGKSFAALRQNPRVLFGFAVVVQIAVVLLTALIMGAVTVAAFSRVLTLRPGSEEYTTLMIGSAGIVAVVGLVVGLGSVAFTALVQGVVAADVAEAVLGEKATLRTLWARVRPVAWRLIGYAALVMGAVFVLLLVIGLVAVGGIGALGGFQRPAMIIGAVVAFLAFLGVIPLLLWLGTKLQLVPSVLVLEHETVRGAMVRSWRLTRGRFWVAFGVMVLISVIMSVAAQVVSTPLTMLASILVPVVAPTGENPASAVIATLLTTLLAQTLTIVIGAVSTVVQSTGSALVYLDCRMRHEGLDQDLLAAVERRHAGLGHGADPFAVDPARAVTREYRPLARTVWDAPPAPPYPSPATGHPATPVFPPAHGQPATGGYGTYAPAVPPAAPPPAPAAAPPVGDDLGEHPDRRWTAPGSGPGSA